jgi:hypothetical protein
MLQAPATQNSKKAPSIPYQKTFGLLSNHATNANLTILYLLFELNSTYMYIIQKFTKNTIILSKKLKENMLCFIY